MVEPLGFSRNRASDDVLGVELSRNIVVVSFAKRDMVRGVSEQAFIAFVRNQVVNNCSPFTTSIAF